MDFHNPKLLGMALVLVAALANPAVAAEPGSEVRIGIVTDGVHAWTPDVVRQLRTEVIDVCSGAHDVVFPEDAVIDGGWSRKGVSAALDEVLARDDLDLVLAVGVGVAADVCARTDIQTPVAVPFAFAECAAGCARLPGLRVNTVGLDRIMARDLEAFRRIVPFSKVAVLTGPIGLVECEADDVARTVVPPDSTAVLVPVEPGAGSVVEALPEGTDAVYLTGLSQLDEASFSSLVDELTAAGLPTFSMIGEAEVEAGVFAGLSTEATLAAMIRAGALDVLDLLEGREDGGEHVLGAGTRLTLNMATARRLGISPGWEVLSEAHRLHERGADLGRPVDLERALDRAVEANLDLMVRDRVVAAGAQDVRSARSAYLPQIGLGVSGVAIDDDHALPAMGQYARFAAGSLTLTQLLYAEDASANVVAQKHLQEAREADREALQMDIAREAAGAYLGLMRAEALVRIEQDNVDLTRTNLDLARLRRSVGSAGAAEVYRWEAELAAARASLLEGAALRRQAERQLSRLLDEPLTTRWRADRPGLEEALAVLGGADQVAHLDTPDGLDRLGVALLDEGLGRAPELEALDAVIAAQEREQQAAHRATWVPQVGLQAGIDHIFAKDDESGIDLGPIGDVFPGFDDTSWNVGVQASLPLTTGGARKARKTKADEEVHRLRLDRRSAEQKLGQRILGALDGAGASWPSISLWRQSADAAARTQELVQDAYGRGAASILDLLDAQNAAIGAELAATTAVYDFLEDWAEVRRSVADLGQ